MIMFVVTEQDPVKTSPGTDRTHTHTHTHILCPLPLVCRKALASLATPEFQRANLIREVKMQKQRKTVK